MRQIEKAVMLQTLDTQWKDHLAAMDYLRQGIHLRGYAQKNPKQEYKREAFEMFSAMLDSIKQEVVNTLARLRIQAPEELDALGPRPGATSAIPVQARGVPRPRPEPSRAGAAVPGPARASGPPRPFVRDERKVGRNEPCPCGSGKKYKHCHGKAA